MKKLFFLAATMVAAMAMNATVYDFSSLSNATDWKVEGAELNAAESSTTKQVYDLKAGVEATTSPVAYSNIVFAITNSKDKEKGFNVNLTANKSLFEFGGKNGIIRLSGVGIGDMITLHVAAKGNTAADFVGDGFPVGAIAVSEDLTLPAKSAGAEGADEQGYIWKDLVYQATASSVEIKEFVAGYRISSITIGAGTDLKSLKAEKAAAKRVMIDGRVFIRKANGEMVSILGL